MTDQALYWPGRRRGSRGRNAAAVPVAMAGSIAFHALVLGYLALRALTDQDHREDGPIKDPIFPDVIRVELIPFTLKEGRHVRINRLASHTDLPTAAIPPRSFPDFHPPEPGRRPTPQDAVPGSAQDLEAGRLSSRPATALRPSGPWGGDVCRDLSNLRAWLAANCQDRAPPPQIETQGSPPAAEARIGQRRLNASEQRRDNGFARQAAANEAWRAYRREDGPYPGLLSMLRDQ